jgi:hypothetical protein
MIKSLKCRVFLYAGFIWLKALRIITCKNGLNVLSCRMSLPIIKGEVLGRVNSLMVYLIKMESLMDLNLA